MVASKTVNETKEKLSDLGQEHVFNFYSKLSEAEQKTFLEQVQSIDLNELKTQVDRLVLGNEKEADFNWDALKPADYISLPENGGDSALWEKAKSLGESIIKEGRVAAFTVAGGQGTRLGYDGPKGTFVVTPLSQKSLFEVFANKITRASERYGVAIPWFIMTSAINHKTTIEAFEANNYFGMPKESLFFFSQALFPAVDLNGKILLEEKGKVVMTPNGHGGSLRALVDSGAIEKMRKEGIDVLSYFQVDNPLVSCIDPAFIGFHVLNQSELSSKMIPKAYPLEKVGIFCQYEGNNLVVEYSDMPKAMQELLDENGEIVFRSGSVAIHLFDRDFIERVGSASSADKLPYHKAVKKIPFINGSGEYESPKELNGVKFEMFVFDALSKANNTVIIEGLRNDNFSPVKNADGIDSPKSCQKDQLNQAIRWLNAAGVELDISPEGNKTKDFSFEINYRFAMDEEDFINQWNNLKNKPTIELGTIIE
jgi:UDP-N-acetylglucosamine/UDP-N-acetylgalactosamine diphosphorylase